MCRAIGRILDPLDLFGVRRRREQREMNRRLEASQRLQDEALKNEQLRREEENLRRDNAVARINALYGVGDGVIKGGTDKLGTVTVLPETLDVAAYAKTRQDGYEAVRKNTLGLLGEEIARNRDEASRQVRFGLARTGLAGGSADIWAHRDITDANQRSLLDASRQAENQVARLRGEDENTRSDLIARVYAGMDADSAAATASQRMGLNRQAALSEPVSGALNNLFAGIGGAWNAYQFANGMNNPYGHLRRSAGAVGGFKGKIS